MLATRRTAVRTTGRWASDRVTRLLGSSAKNETHGHSHDGGKTQCAGEHGHGHGKETQLNINNRTAKQPNDPTNLLKSLEQLGGKHALFGSWLLEEGLDKLGNFLDETDTRASRQIFVHPSLEARRVPGSGVGLFASKTIPKGEVLIRVPREIFHPLSAEFAEKVAKQKVPKFVKHLETQCALLGAPQFAKHVLFALHLLFELGDETSGNAPYLASLPTLNGIDHRDGTDTSATEGAVPLLWEPSQLATLRGTPTFANVLRRKAFVKNAHVAIFGGTDPGTAGTRVGGSTNPTSPTVPLQRFQWALSTILSRATSGANAPYALLPGICLFNHAGVDANCVLEGTARSDEKSTTSSSDSTLGSASESSSGESGHTSDWRHVDAVSKRDVSKDEQLTISYGDNADNDRLLRVYGFCVSGNVNDRREVLLNVNGAALELWRAFDKYGPGVTLARNAILRKHGLPRLSDVFNNMDSADAVTQKAFQETVEKALGGGVSFRDPGDFQSAMGGAGDDAADGKEKEASFFDDVEGDSMKDGASDAEDNKSSPLVWSCYVAHPSKPLYPKEPSSPMDSSSNEAERLSNASTNAARGANGSSISAQALLASVRTHLLTGTEPPGPDGHEPNPWAPVSEMNEAATRAVVGEAAYLALREHTESLRPNVARAKQQDVMSAMAMAAANPNAHSHSHSHGAPVSAPADTRDAHAHSHGASPKQEKEETIDPKDPFAGASEDVQTPLSQKAAMDARLDLAGGSAWARSALALRRGQEEILEHLLGQSSI